MIVYIIVPLITQNKQIIIVVILSLTFQLCIDTAEFSNPTSNQIHNSYDGKKFKVLPAQT